jgi:uncharacterized membrane protein
MNPQQPQYGTPPPPMAAPNRWGPTSFGMEAHVLAGLSYLSMFIIGIIGPLIVFFVEKNNRYVKFHAAQGILIGIAEAVWIFALIILNVIVAAIVGGATAATSSTAAASATAGTGLLGFCVAACVGFLGGLALLGAVIWGAVAGFSGKATKLPLIGNIAERWAGGPVTPAF